MKIEILLLVFVMAISFGFLLGYYADYQERKQIWYECIDKLYSFKKMGMIFFLDLALDKKHVEMLNEITKWRD